MAGPFLRLSESPFGRAALPDDLETLVEKVSKLLPVHERWRLAFGAFLRRAQDSAVNSEGLCRNILCKGSTELIKDLNTPDDRGFAPSATIEAAVKGSPFPGQL